MARKQIKVSRRIIFTWCMLIGLIFYFTPSSWTSKLQLAFSGVFRWPLAIGSNISLTGSSHQQHPALRSHEQAQYLNHIAFLEEQLRQKQFEIDTLAAIRQRISQLDGASLIQSDVVKITVTQARAEMLINRGKNDGIEKGLYVLGDNSIIGIISDVSNRQARVRLITDSAFKAAVTIPDLKVGGVIQGCGDSKAVIRLVKAKAQSGEEIFINKKAGLLDAPMIAARAVSSDRSLQSPLLWDITVEPACDLKTLTNVAVLIMNPKD